MSTDTERDAILQERETLEPEFFARLRALPAVQAIVAAGVAEVELLRECALARAGRDNYRLSTNTKAYSSAARELRAAAAALARLDSGPVAASRPASDGSNSVGTVNNFYLAALQAAVAAFRELRLGDSVASSASDSALSDSGGSSGGSIATAPKSTSVSDADEAAFATLSQLFVSRGGAALVVALRTLADGLDRIARLKPQGPLRQRAKTDLLRNLILLGLPTDRALHADIATLYGFVFEQRAPSDIAHLLRRAHKFALDARTEILRCAHKLAD